MRVEKIGREIGQEGGKGWALMRQLIVHKG
jgi:hypothetical protein